MMNWEGFGRKRHSPGGTEENHEKPPVKIACRRGRDLNLGPPEGEAEVLTTRPRCQNVSDNLQHYPGSQPFRQYCLLPIPSIFILTQ
jgi:hypothetical protein